ncbi:MAG: trehalose-phosphatase [Hyphomicrobiales bacterium]|nr:MAG: trehalose-phosphatase [Hyphomicrobiales bacterium]
MTQMLLDSGASVPALAIFTDFDGTLVEIAESPEAVHIPSDLAEQIDRATREFDNAFAVITGREIADIDRFLSPLHLPIAGAHGSQRRRADGSMEEVGEDLLIGAEEIARAIEPLAVAHPELLIEPKPGTVALHYRQAPELGDACLRALEEVLESHPEYSLVEGKMVYEARPIGFDKGAALRAFMQEEPFKGRTPIFIGDDRTDEDAFRAAQELGGVGIKLGPGDTAVHALLRGLGDLVHRDEPLLADTPAN